MAQGRKMHVLNRWLLAIACLALAWWLFEYRPWEREIAVRTTAEAFVGPSPGEELISKQERHVELYLSITPAAWPEEARVMYSAARRGTIVHVTVPDGAKSLNFDVEGLSKTGKMRVNCKSIEEAQHILQVLQINQH